MSTEVAKPTWSSLNRLVKMSTCSWVNAPPNLRLTSSVFNMAFSLRHRAFGTQLYL